MSIAASLRRRASVRRDLRGLRTDLEEEAALVGRLSRAEILHLDGVGGGSRLVVEDLDLDEVSPSYLRAQWEAANDGEIAQRELAHQAADDDEREQHSEEKVE